MLWNVKVLCGLLSDGTETSEGNVIFNFGIWWRHMKTENRVIETRVEVWKNEKCFGDKSRRRVFPQLFRVLPNFHECFYNSIETRRTCFLFLLENTATRKRKTTCFWLSKCKFSLLAPLLRQQHMLILCLHRIIKTRFLTNQRAYFLIVYIITKSTSALWLVNRVYCAGKPMAEK